MIGALLVPVAAGPADALPSEAGEYNPLTPARVLDTRGSTGGHPGPLTANSSYAVQIAGVGGVPVVAEV
jgi:hypothetical protein